MWRPIFQSLCILALVNTSRAGPGLIGKYFTDQDVNSNNFYWKVDPNIDFKWGLKGPRTAYDWFGVVWTGTVTAVNTVVLADCDDRVHITVGGKEVISNWHIPYSDWRPFATSLPAGEIVIRYAENYGEARCRLLRAKTTDVAAITDALWTAYAEGDYWTYVWANFEAIPASAFSHTVKPTTGTKLQVYTPGTDKDTSFRTVSNWFTLAVIKEKTLDGDSYELGDNLATCFSSQASTTGTTVSSECIVPCRAFDYIYQKSNDNANLAGDNVMIKLIMGEYVDYFRPKKGFSLCTMLQSQESHEWSPTEDGPWYDVDFNRNGIGGTSEEWPASNTFADTRRVANFWRYHGKGSCCLNTRDTTLWRKRWWERPRGDTGKGFTIKVRFHARDSVLPLTKVDEWNTVTEKIGTADWIVYAQVPDSLKIENRVYKAGENDPFWGWNTKYIHTNKHAAFIRNCEDFKPWGDKVELILRMGRNIWDFATEKTTWTAGPDGKAVDKGFWLYFRPNQNKTLCDMLGSATNHQISDNGVMYYTPVYTDDKRFRGGSQWGFPKKFAATTMIGSMNLNHLPFWTGEFAAYGRYDATDAEGWGKAYQMLVRVVTDREVSRPYSNVAWKANWPVNALLQLGTWDEKIDVSARKDVWNDRVLDRPYIAGEDTNTTKAVVDAAVTIIGQNQTLKWTVQRNYFYPPLFGQSTNEENDNYWVRYYSICVKPSVATAWSAIMYVDDAIRLYQDGIPLHKFVVFKEQEQTLPLTPVAAGKWTQLIFKLYDGGWSSGLSLKFNIDVDWKVNENC